MPPRLIRRAPLSERITAYFNPFDALLNISTWLSSYDWDSVQFTLATPMGVFLNVMCFVARVNSNNDGRRRGAEDVLRRGTGTGSIAGWGAAITYSVCVPSTIGGTFLFCHPFNKLNGELNSWNHFWGKQFYLLSWALATLSLANTVYCFSKTRPYRLFETNIEIQPETPSARRVRVDSSPSSSPLKRLIEPLLNSLQSQEHPSQSRDVWEVSIWDPAPLSLCLFGLFSPAHVAVYFLSFPLTSSLSYSSAVGGYVSRPTMSPYSVVLTVLATQFLLSVQLIYVQKCFMQQERDKALLSKQLMHEYDTKYVHPRLNTLKRNVGVQTSNAQTGERGGVVLFAPMLARQGFKTAPNPNYAELTVPNQISPSKRAQDSPLSTNCNTYNSPLSTRGPARRSQLGNRNVKRSVSSGTWMDPGSFEDVAPTTSRRDTGYDGTHIKSSSDLVREGSYNEPSSKGSDRGQASTGAEAHIPSSNYGMHGLVNMSQHNSRSLSPTKMASPFKKGASVRGSSYAASLTLSHQ